MESQAVAIAVFGNSHSRGLACPRFWPEAAVFRHTKTLVFEAKVGRFLAAVDPASWVDQLRDRGVKRFHVHVGRGDYGGEAFAGGGAPWVVEAIREDGIEVWLSRQELLDRNDPDHKIWQSRFIRVEEREPVCPMPPRPLEAVTNKMRSALLQAIRFVRTGFERSDSATLDWLETTFQAALQSLDSSSPESVYAYSELVCENNLSVESRRLLAAAQRAWVFGGMGSWNDVAIRPGEQAEYKAVSQDLYQAIHTSICDAVNTGA